MIEQLKEQGFDTLSTVSHGRGHPHENFSDPQGIGSVVQWQYMCLALSFEYGMKYHFEGFKDIGHSSYNNTTQEEWDNRFNEFFNLKWFSSLSNKQKSQIAYLSRGDVAKLAFPLLEKWRKDEIGLRFRSKINYQRWIPTPGVFNVVIHLRSNNPGDIPPNVKAMDTFGVWMNVDNLKTLIRSIKDGFCIPVDSDMKCRFHVVTQRYNDVIFDMDENVILHINNEPEDDLWHMMNADMLVMAKSSFSWVAHFLNPKAMLVAKENYHQPTYPLNLYIGEDWRLRRKGSNAPVRFAPRIPLTSMT
jgi:hypothetical protein